jgi:acetoin utilization deacetylase AcuC-like enzyme
MQELGFYFNPIFLKHINVHSPFHPECPERLEAILNYIKKSDLNPFINYQVPIKNDSDFIKIVHDKTHFDTIYKKLTDEKSGLIDSDTFFSEETLQASLIAANSGIVAIDDILKLQFNRAFCCVRPPGHHAERNSSMGFCLFNNVAVAANYFLLKDFKKVMIVDFDVHHGNGTQDFFYNNPNVLFISMHQRDIYPHNGFENQSGIDEAEGSTINIPLNAHATYSDLTKKLDTHLSERIRLFNPEALIFSSGFDAHINDPIGGLNFESEDYYFLTLWFINAISNPTIPILSMLEGGYSLKASSESAYYHLKAMMLN